MTSNRAHKRAARAIAAKKNIRYPEADTLADPKMASGERPRPKQLVVSTDPNDPELAALAAEQFSIPEGLELGPGITGGQPTTSSMARTVARANDLDESIGGAEIDPTDLQRVRIVFALRYADLLSAGLEDKQTLDLLASSLSTVPGLAAKTLAAAIPEVRKALDAGFTQGVAWESCKNLVGAHLYYMLQISDTYGPSPRMLKATAGTLESELRLGVF